jgi:hypothetical protein
MNPPETLILIPGRTARQGASLNEGKFSAGYVEEIRPAFESPYPSDGQVLRAIERPVREPQIAGRDGEKPAS